jgi:uncharacterized integral membrane protein
MLALLIAVIFGAGVGYFATQNTIPVTLQFGAYAIEEIPLYLVVVGSLLIGLFIAWIIYLARSVSSTITIHGKDNEVRRARHTIAQMEARVRELEVENTRLRSRYATQPEYEEPAYPPS